MLNAEKLQKVHDALTELQMDMQEYITAPEAETAKLFKNRQYEAVTGINSARVNIRAMIDAFDKK